MHPVNAIQTSAAFPFLAIGLALTMSVLGGCQPTATEEAGAPPPTPVTGQVFLVMPSGENLRLGSVRLQVFEEEAIRVHLATREQHVSHRRAELREQLAAAEAKAEAASAAHLRAEEAYRTRDAEIRAELKERVSEVEGRIAAHRATIEANKAFIDSIDTLPQAPEGIPPRDEYEVYRERREKWLSMSPEERVSWGEVLRSLNEDLESEIQEMAEAHEAAVLTMADELQALDEVAFESEDAERAAIREARELRERLENFPDYEDYLVDLPEPLERGRTDADGDFAFYLSPDRSYVLFADAERRFEGEQKEFRWFVKVPSQSGSRVLLSNHNLITSDAVENVIVVSRSDESSET